MLRMLIDFGFLVSPLLKFHQPKAKFTKQTFDLKAQFLKPTSQLFPCQCPPVRINWKGFTVKPAGRCYALARPLERPSQKLSNFSVHRVLDLWDVERYRIISFIDNLFHIFYIYIYIYIFLHVYIHIYTYIHLIYRW